MLKYCKVNLYVFVENLNITANDLKIMKVTSVIDF